MLRQGAIGEIYNIGAGNETPNRVLVDKLLSLLGVGEEMVDYVEDRLGHDRRYSVDITKITELGWTKQRTLDEALGATVDWYQRNEWWWRPLKPTVRILVTGAAGQVGRELAEFCTVAGDDVVALGHGALDVPIATPSFRHSTPRAQTSSCMPRRGLPSTRARPTLIAPTP